MSDFLRTLRQFRRFRSAPNSQTLFLKNPTALGAPAYPLPAPFACSPSALLSEKDLQAERSTLPSRRRLQTLAHLQIPLRHGKPSHLSPSERLFYSAFLFGWRFANKTRLIFPFHRHKIPRANCNAPARSAPFLFTLHFSLKKPPRRTAFRFFKVLRCPLRASLSLPPARRRRCFQNPLRCRSPRLHSSPRGRL